MFGWRKRRAPLPIAGLDDAVDRLTDWTRPLLAPRGNAPYLAGRCLVCGRATVFFCSDRKLARESLECAACGATSRYRSIARGLLRALEKLTGERLPSLDAVSRARFRRRLRVYDTQVAFRYPTIAYPIPELLGACPDLEVSTSSYRPDLALGVALPDGATNQNLESLTFDDRSFDIVITSDVMEHVRLADRAHAEIRRVLAPGGVYLFTVPHFRHCDTIEFVRIHDPADPDRDEVLGEPQYHGDANSPSGRVLTYRGFGLDLDRRLERLGFAVTYEREDRPELGLLDTELFFCELAEEPRRRTG